MGAACRTFRPLNALRRTRLDTLSFPRNEGVPGSSPGVGSSNEAVCGPLSSAPSACVDRLCQVGAPFDQDNFQ